jgi:hypothetical protein
MACIAKVDSIEWEKQKKILDSNTKERNSKLEKTYNCVILHFTIDGDNMKKYQENITAYIKIANPDIKLTEKFKRNFEKNFWKRKYKVIREHGRYITIGLYKMVEEAVKKSV